MASLVCPLSPCGASQRGNLLGLGGDIPALTFGHVPDFPIVCMVVIPDDAGLPRVVETLILILAHGGGVWIMSI